MALENIASWRPSKSDDPKPTLNEVGEQILVALEGVAQSAQDALACFRDRPTRKLTAFGLLRR